MSLGGVWICAVTAIIMCAGAAAGEQCGEDVVRRVEENIGSLETLRCTFERSRYMKEADRTIGFSGTLVMKMPYLLRVGYPAQTIVVDGASVWVYVPRNRQVRVSTFIENEETFPSPQGIFRRYSRGREIRYRGEETIDGRPCDVIDLVSDDENDVRVAVWIDRGLGFPVKTEETLVNGDTVGFTLGDVVLNEPVEDGTFMFEVPEGVELIDLRE